MSGLIFYDKDGIEIRVKEDCGRMAVRIAVSKRIEDGIHYFDEPEDLDRFIVALTKARHDTWSTEVILKDAVKAYLAALDHISTINANGRDDSGKKDNASYREWLAADCHYTEALDAMRAVMEAKA